MTPFVPSPSHFTFWPWDPWGFFWTPHQRLSDGLRMWQIKSPLTSYLSHLRNLLSATTRPCDQRTKAPRDGQVRTKPSGYCDFQRSLGTTTLNQLLSGELNGSRRKYRNLLVVMISSAEVRGSRLNATSGVSFTYLTHD